MVVGMLAVQYQYPVVVQLVHAAVAAALLVSLLVLVVLTGLASSSSAEQPVRQGSPLVLLKEHRRAGIHEMGSRFDRAGDLMQYGDR
jgi:hypothetical protein